MATCAYCKNTILFGGAREGGHRYCNDHCKNSHTLTRARRTLSDTEIDAHTHQVYRGRCPLCAGPGPNEVHVSHRVWSVIVLTRWEKRPAICCRRCGNKRKVEDSLFSLAFGWWGFPYGFIATPIQVFRNLSGLLTTISQPRQSLELRAMVELQLAARQLETPVTGSGISTDSVGSTG